MSLLSAPLQAFIVVVEKKTVHGAAKEIGLTQTGVTQRIRSIENDLQTTLFVRSRKGMQLTEEGEALYQYCQTALAAEGETLSRISGGLDLRLKILGPTSIMSTRVVPELIRIGKEFSRLFITAEVDDRPNRIDVLKRGEAQFVIVTPEEVVDEVDSKLLKPERYILVGSSRWKTQSTRDIVSRFPIIDFSSSDQASLAYLKSFGFLGDALKQRHFINNNESLIEMISSGIGYGVLTEEVARPHLKSGKLIWLNQRRVHQNRLALAWYPRPYLPEAYSSLISSLK